VLADALPGSRLVARVSSLAGLASRGNFFFEMSGPARQFDAILRFDRADLELKAGTSVQVVVAGNEIRNALHVPRQALFEKRGKPVVYVKNGAGFAPHEVKITHRTESRVVLEGLHEGDTVALVNPEEEKKPITSLSVTGVGR
jgi:multidrug efflux pump subunit AcrA (membrane-fusion protein)